MSISFLVSVEIAAFSDVLSISRVIFSLLVIVRSFDLLSDLHCTNDINTNYFLTAENSSICITVFVYVQWQF